MPMPSRRRGFTLIELLVVLSIIAALLGLLIPGIAIVRKKAKMAKAQSEIEQIAAALASYRNVNASYPETYNPPMGGAEVYGAALVASGTPRKYTELVENDWKSIADALNAQLNSVDRDLLGKIDITKDPWGHAYHYRPAKYFPFNGAKPAGTDPALDSEDPPNPDTYQLWSMGPDGHDDGGQGDDVANWKKR